MEKTGKESEFKDEVVGTVPVKEGELRLTVSERNGWRRVDFRVFGVIKGEIRPTRQGFVIEQSKWAEFLKGIEKISEKITKK
jgi:hypothetical protein